MFGLYPGVDWRQAVAEIRHALVEFERTKHARSQGARVAAATVYAIAVDNLESALRRWLVGPSFVNQLRNDRYWQLLRGPGELAAFDLILTSEVEEQVRGIERILKSIEKFLAEFGSPDLTTAVLDTNVLLHHLPIDQMPWHEVLGAGSVRLIVPLRVVEELDQKKYAARNALADRARGVLANLGRRLASERTADAQAWTVQVLNLGAPRRRPADADEEILNDCLSLMAATPRLWLVTGDLSMQIRARALSIPFKALGDEHRRSLQ